MKGMLEQCLTEDFTLLHTWEMGCNGANYSFYACVVKIGISPWCGLFGPPLWVLVAGLRTMKPENSLDVRPESPYRKHKKRIQWNLTAAATSSWQHCSIEGSCDDYHPQSDDYHYCVWILTIREILNGLSVCLHTLFVKGPIVISYCPGRGFHVKGISPVNLPTRAG